MFHVLFFVPLHWIHLEEGETRLWLWPGTALFADNNPITTGTTIETRAGNAALRVLVTFSVIWPLILPSKWHRCFATKSAASSASYPFWREYVRGARKSSCKNTDFNFLFWVVWDHALRAGTAEAAWIALSISMLDIGHYEQKRLSLNN